jgi:RimJ/RimL family protein N-acetyltransferase
MSDRVEEFALPVAVTGELIELCAPDERYAALSDWFSWMNHAEITRYLERGATENTPAAQVEFLHEAQRTRRLYIVSDRQRYVGVVSLSAFHHGRREADLSVLIHPDKAPVRAPLFALEACARMIDVAFGDLGLLKVRSGHHIALARWAQRKEILGFRLEGIQREAFRKGSEVADTLLSSLLKSEYERLRSARGGELWDGVARMRGRLKALPKTAYSECLLRFQQDQGRTYYDGIDAL